MKRRRRSSSYSYSYSYFPIQDIFPFPFPSTYSSLLLQHILETRVNRLVIGTESLGHLRDGIQLVLTSVYDLLLLLLVLLRALFHHRHTTLGRAVLLAHGLDGLHVATQRLELLLDGLELGHEAHTHLLDLLVRLSDVLRAGQQLLVLLVELLLQLGDLLVQSLLQRDSLLLLLEELLAVLTHLLLYDLLLGSDGLTLGGQLVLLLLDGVHHTGQTGIVGSGLVVQLLGVGDELSLWIKSIR